jgi:hypothetical protein
MVFNSLGNKRRERVRERERERSGEREGKTNTSKKRFTYV